MAKRKAPKLEPLEYKIWIHLERYNPNAENEDAEFEDIPLMQMGVTATIVQKPGESEDDLCERAEQVAQTLHNCANHLPGWTA